MKRLFLLSAVLLLINGCSESNDTIDEEVVVDPVIETFTITADHTNIKSLQIVTLTIPEAVQLTNQIYTAKFDATEITLSRNELNKLSFMAPDLPSKSYNFLIEINGKRANLNFTLQSIENVENVAVFIENEMLTPLKEINKIANIELNNPNINVKEKELIEFGNEFYTKANTAYNGLSVDDKQKLRKFLIANNISINTIIEEKSSFKSAFDIAEWESKLDNQMQKVITSKIKLVSVVGLLAVLISTPDITYTKVLSLVVGAAGIYKLHRAIKERDLLLDMSFHPFESFIKTMSDNKTTNNKMSSEVYNFQNNVSKNLTIQSSGRKLQKSDISHPNSKIAASTSAINGTDLVWNQFKESIDKLINKIGSFFNINQNKITSTIGLPEKSAEEVITLDNKYFKIDNVPSAISQQLTIKDEIMLQLKFSTKGELPSSFDAKLKYDDGVFKSESDFKVSLLSNISLSGNLDFGEKLINSSTKKSFTITNQSNTPITITSIALPNGFVSNWTGGSIPTSGSKQVEITFNPIDSKDYSGTIIVKNNIDESDTTIGVTATGSKGLTLLGDLNFGEVEVDKELTKSLILVNGTQSNIHVSSISLPTGYTADWTSGTIGVSGSVTVYVTFKPTQIKDYLGEVVVNNDIDQINNKINIKGVGVGEGNIDLSGTWNFELTNSNICGGSGFCVFNTNNNVITFSNNMNTDVTDVTEYPYTLDGNKLTINDSYSEYFCPEFLTTTILNINTIYTSENLFEGVFSSSANGGEGVNCTVGSYDCSGNIKIYK